MKTSDSESLEIYLDEQEPDYLEFCNQIMTGIHMMSESLENFDETAVCLGLLMNCAGILQDHGYNAQEILEKVLNSEMLSRRVLH